MAICFMRQPANGQIGGHGGQCLKMNGRGMVRCVQTNKSSTNSQVGTESCPVVIQGTH